MPDNFVRPNRDLEERIRQMNDPNDLQNMLAEVPVTEVLRGAKPLPVAEPVGSRFKKVVLAPDGHEVRIQADTIGGIYILEDAVRRGQIVNDIL
jgi:hypothetical protein